MPELPVLGCQLAVGSILYFRCADFGEFSQGHNVHLNAATRKECHSRTGKAVQSLTGGGVQSRSRILSELGIKMP